MSAVEALAPSRRLRSAARAELERSARRHDQLRSKAAALKAELDRIEAAAAELAEKMVSLSRFAEVDLGLSVEHNEPATRPAPRGDGTVVRGRQIREEAVRMIATSDDAERPIHYTEWFDRFNEAGFRIVARDPLAVFLTQLGRSPVVRRTSKAGVYEIDWNASERYERGVGILRERLSATSATGSEAGQTDSVIALANELTVAERRLRESLASLAGQPHSAASVHPR